MTIDAKVDQGRNEQCGCGSGLKFKYCHGDIGKRAACERVVSEHMVGLIMREKCKRGLITNDEYEAFVDKPNQDYKKSNEHEVGEILDKAGLKRCAGALCSAPIPDTEEFCIQCKSKVNRR